MDRDGRDDLIVGMYGGRDSLLYGNAWLTLSSDLGASGDYLLRDVSYSLFGENTGDNAGMSVSSAGDVNGDGLDDILIGAPHNSDAGFQAGKTYLVFSQLY